MAISDGIVGIKMWYYKIIKNLKSVTCYCLLTGLANTHTGIGIHYACVHIYFKFL